MKKILISLSIILAFQTIWCQTIETETRLKSNCYQRSADKKCKIRLVEITKVIDSIETAEIIEGYKLTYDSKEFCGAIERRYEKTLETYDVIFSDNRNSLYFNMNNVQKAFDSPNKVINDFKESKIVASNLFLTQRKVTSYGSIQFDSSNKTFYFGQKVEYGETQYNWWQYLIILFVLIIFSWGLGSQSATSEIFNNELTTDSRIESFIFTIAMTFVITIVVGILYIVLFNSYYIHTESEYITSIVGYERIYLFILRTVLILVIALVVGYRRK